MKKIYINMIWMVIMALGIAGCSDTTHEGTETPGTGNNNGNEEHDPINLVVEIEDAYFSQSNTYASTTDETPMAQERQVKTDLELYIFDASGQFHDHLTLPFVYNSTTIHRTDTFKFSSGDWYFYAFVNLLDGMIPEPTANMSRTAFETTTLDDKLVDMFYNKYGMVLGTLVEKKITIPVPANDNDVFRVNLPVGRMVAKVLFVDYPTEVKGDLKGHFNINGSKPGGHPGYCIIHEPLKNYLVGQWQGPFRQLGSQVISPHYYVYQYEDDFEPYPYFDEVDQEPHKYPSTNMGSHYYARENTNQTPLTKTTSTFSLYYQYVPDASEIYDVKNPETNGASLDPANDGTFWVAVFPTGDELIYNEDPTGITHAGFGMVESVKCYEQGLNYYKIPIADYTEQTPSLRYAVIRNHSYRLTVLSISRLGSPDWKEVIDPEKPLEVPAGIEFTLDVSPWEHYTMDTELK